MSYLFEGEAIGVNSNTIDVKVIEPIIIQGKHFDNVSIVFQTPEEAWEQFTKKIIVECDEDMSKCVEKGNLIMYSNELIIH